MIALQNVFDKLIRKLEVKILILGFKGAGKTTILKRFEFGNIIKISKKNSEVENVNFNDVKFLSWDLDCGLNSECIEYFEYAKGMVFVIDSGDREKLPEIKKILHEILSHSELKNTPLLVVANKSDLNGAMNIEEIKKNLDLNGLTCKDWNVMSCCARDDNDLCKDVEGSKEMGWFFGKI